MWEIIKFLWKQEKYGSKIARNPCTSFEKTFHFHFSILFACYFIQNLGTISFKAIVTGQSFGNVKLN